MSFKELTIGQKISASFLAILVLLLFVSMVSILGFQKIVGNATEVLDGNRLDGTLAQREVDHLNWVNQVNALLTDDSVTALDVQTDDHKCGFGKWLYGQGRKDAELLVPDLKPYLKSIESPHSMLHKSAIEIGNSYKPVDLRLGEFLSQKKTDHLLWTHKIKDALLNRSSELTIQMDPTKCGLGIWIYSEKTMALKKQDKQFAAIIDEMIPLHKALHESSKNIRDLLQAGKFDQAYASFLSNTMPDAEKTLAKLDQTIAWHNENIKGVQKANQIYAGQTLPALATIQAVLGEIRKTVRKNIMSDDVMLMAAKQSKTRVIVLSIAVVFVGIFFSFFTTRGLNKILKNITSTINEGANQVANAARQISTSSQSLAENASEQAATVEQTSASVQEITSSSSQTAEMTRGAEELMNQNIEKSGQSLKAIVEITSKINQIVADSDKIALIIKTIDQIAFQTNLLALNAAVEAARAGEAGAGFAVVADEVRRLAIQATQAARNTQELLDETISRIDQISSSVSEMSENFEGIVESATIIGEKTAGITAASQEVAKGLQQIANATLEIDKVTQEIASNSEESAASSEELSAQAEEMGQIVAALARMVYGRKKALLELDTDHAEKVLSRSVKLLSHPS